MKKRLEIKILALLLVALFTAGAVRAQHTLGFTVGYGMSNARFEPKLETKALWGSYNAGITWRYYGKQRFVGGFGIDLEFLQQGFSYPVNHWVEDEKDYRYYTRHVNTLMLPIVWQPHFYLFNHHLRVYLEAAATFSYSLSSTFENEYARDKGEAGWKGDYPYKLTRDNRWGYGLAGGAGLSFLVKRFEINVRARYYFGLGDVVRNRNKYADNHTDGPENPFAQTPTRSPLDNLSISVGLSYRFNKEGFDVWKKRGPKNKINKEFNYNKK